MFLPNRSRIYPRRKLPRSRWKLTCFPPWKKIGHHVLPLAVGSDLSLIRECLENENPDIAFNMLEEFHGVAIYDQHMVSYLELMRKPYTGCNPRGLMLAHDKALAKKILSYHRIRSPEFAVYPLAKVAAPPSRLPGRLQFPVLVKSVIEESSMGISQASIVHNQDQLAARVHFVHEQIGTDALVEEYIDGRELYLGVLGNQRLQTFPIWELLFEKMPEDIHRIATAKVKWDPDYQKKYGIRAGAAKNLPGKTKSKIVHIGKRVYKALGLSGYARIDFRLTAARRNLRAGSQSQSRPHGRRGLCRLGPGRRNFLSRSAAKDPEPGNDLQGGVESLMSNSPLLDEIIQGLESSPRKLPCKLFYDERGSRLFEEICTLEEYYPTRTEIGLLEKYGRGNG